MKLFAICLPVLLALTIASAQSTTPFAGLIVDAKGLKFTPCMFPRIYSDGGKEVWGTYNVSSQFANDVGVASFVQSLEAAASLKDRGGPHQLVVRALGITNQCDATISQADAERVILENNRAQFLERFKITFVY
jgi:hypothetical protein